MLYKFQRPIKQLALFFHSYFQIKPFKVVVCFLIEKSWSVLKHRRVRNWSKQYHIPHYYYYDQNPIIISIVHLNTLSRFPYLYYTYCPLPLSSLPPPTLLASFFFSLIFSLLSHYLSKTSSKFSTLYIHSIFSNLILNLFILPNFPGKTKLFTLAMFLFSSLLFKQ